MPTTVANLIDEVHRKLSGIYKEEIDVINEGGAFVTADTSLTLSYNSTSLGEGDLIEIEQELCYVVDASSNPVTVIRAFHGTTAVSHADSTLVRVNPRFSRIDIREALKQTISSYKELYWVDHVQVSVSTHDQDNRGTLVPIPENYKKILAVRYRNDDGVVARLNDAWISRDFGAGGSTYVNLEKAFYGPQPSGGVALDIMYSMPFDTSTFLESTQLEAQVEFPEELHDLAIFGAMWRLLSQEEGASANPHPQGQFRRREENPPGYAQQVALSYRQLHDLRLNDEEYKLAERYG